MAKKQTLVSAPGKVLLAGGYLVLDPAYPGVVVATSSRFYSLVQSPLSEPEACDPSPADAQSSLSPPARVIRVRSHQFIGAEWIYLARASADGSSFVLTQTKATAEAEHAGKNPFVGLALLYALRVAAEKAGREEVEQRLAEGLDIFVMGDNDFYSQRETLAKHGQDSSKAPTTAALRSLPPFTKQSCPIREVHKTGLGSSAAMTTSLVSALLIHLGAVKASAQDSEEQQLDGKDIAFIHNVAQLAHCAAQGKVGSGFDVSAAVWGSQVYRRFEPKVLDGLMGGRVGIEGSDETLNLDVPPLLSAMSASNPQWRPSPLQSQSADKLPVGHPTAAEGLASVVSGEAGTAQLVGMESLLSQLALTTQSKDGNSSSSSSVGAGSTFFRPAPIALPPFLSLVLADVDAGSNTPSLVGQVLKWRKEKPEWAAQLYSILASANQYLADCLLALSVAYLRDKQNYEAVVEWASQVPSSKWEEEFKNPGATKLDRPMLEKFVNLRRGLRSVRGGMRELGIRAGCPVEPDEMGHLIQASVDGAPGIAGGGVPGAGGYDALYLIHVVPPSSLSTAAGATPSPDSEEAAEASPARGGVEKIWAEWEKLSVGPLLSTAGSGLGLRLLDVDAAPGVRDARVQRVS